jgi:CRISPR/Cas system CMR subunit Cmr4 (Cas7 group RAMP superfamily)
MTKSAKQPIRAGDKVIRDAATQNQGRVKLGDAAPVFRPIRAGDKVMPDAATQNQGRVKLGDAAPVFRPSK